MKSSYLAKIQDSANKGVARKPTRNRSAKLVQRPYSYLLVNQSEEQIVLLATR